MAFIVQQAAYIGGFFKHEKRQLFHVAAPLKQWDKCLRYDHSMLRMNPTRQRFRTD